MTIPAKSLTCRTLLLAVATAVLLSGPVAADETLSDIRADREAARDAEAAALAELELLELEDQRIAEILAEIQLAVDSQAARVEGARQALAAAEREVVDREILAATAAEEVAITADQVRRRAVDAYVGTDTSAEPWLQSGDINRTAVRIAMLEFTAGNERDLIDELRTLQAQREAHVVAGEQARQEADDLRVLVEDELAELQVRLSVQGEIQFELLARIDLWQAEAAQRSRDIEDMGQLIVEYQAKELGVSPGDAGAASIQGFAMPSAGTVGSPFGSRVHPIFGTVRQHAGVDISGSTGDPVWASKGGRVIFAGRKGGYGNAVVIQHEGNIATLYAHMSETLVNSGDQVDGGEVIGLVGSTGWSTGPHLHFETRIDGVPKDPLLLLP